MELERVFTELRQSLDAPLSWPMEKRNYAGQGRTSLLPKAVDLTQWEWTAMEYTLADVPGIAMRVFRPSGEEEEEDDEEEAIELAFRWFRALAPISRIRKVDVWVYLTPLRKQWSPHEGTRVLNEMHVNTGFTQSCPRQGTRGEICIYRREEWLKVLVHESFHTFGLDFSATSYQNAPAIALNNVFRRISRATPVLAYEGFTEFWARVVHLTLHTHEYADFVAGMERQRAFNAQQVATVLGIMGITFAELVGGAEHRRGGGYRRRAFSRRRPGRKPRRRPPYMWLRRASQRRHRYRGGGTGAALIREKTNVVAYYVVAALLHQHVDAFLQWSAAHAFDPLFHFTGNSIADFNAFVEKCAASTHFDMHVPTDVVSLRMTPPLSQFNSSS